MFENTIKVLETEINKLERQQKCFRDEFIFRKDTKELQQAISILEENQTFFGMKIVLKEDIPKDEIWFSKDNKIVGIFKILGKVSEKCP